MPTLCLVQSLLSDPLDKELVVLLIQVLVELPLFVIMSYLIVSLISRVVA